MDLFAGLGGFHLALKRFGFDCVLASEIDENLQELYERNFGIRPVGDIRQIHIADIPKHDILCAGFPCQPFSKAGSQNGFACPRWGDLFDYVLKILEKTHPPYFILENVRNLQTHNNGNTWYEIKTKLEKLDYYISSHVVSPHQIGIPQIRERVFIVGSASKISDRFWSYQADKPSLSVREILDDNPPEARSLSKQVEDCLNVWQEFIERYPQDKFLPSFPIWSMEFKATYPYTEKTPHALKTDVLRRYKGVYGKLLRNIPVDDIMNFLPSYARKKQNQFPRWKVKFIQQNRELYKNNKQWIGKWLPSILQFPPSLQKFEWNCKGENRNIWDYIIQFRASGVRVKRPNTAPSLVAMTATQIPIVGWEKRYMTPRECARLQSMDALNYLPTTLTQTVSALGNAVNVDIVEMIMRNLLKEIEN